MNGVFFRAIFAIPSDALRRLLVVLLSLVVLVECVIASGTTGGWAWVLTREFIGLVIVAFWCLWHRRVPPIVEALFP